MIPFSFYWDTRRKWIGFKLDGLASIYRERGRDFVKIFGLRFRFPIKKRKITSPMKLLYLKDIHSFISEWKIRKAEVVLSHPDPMINGILYGLVGALNKGGGNVKINLKINFLGKNWSRGEITLSPRIISYYFLRWIFLRQRKGGEKSWRLQI